MGTAADRIVRVLNLLVEAGHPLTLTELGRRLAIEKSSASRMLRDLAKHGLLEREEGRGKFRLGLRLVEFARTVLDQTELRTVSRPHLEQLRDETNESVHLAVFRAGHVIYIDKAEAPTFVRTRTEAGDLAPPHCTASGKAILAWLPDAELQRWFREQKLPSYTSHTRTTPRELLPHLRRIRSQGYALDDEEYVSGVRCVAAPILDFKIEVLGSVGVSGLAGRLRGEHLRRVVPAVMRTASAISHRLGGKAHGGPDDLAPPRRHRKT